MRSRAEGSFRFSPLPRRARPRRIGNRLDAKAARWFATLMNFPHRRVGQLNVATETIGIKQRESRSICFKPLANGVQGSRIARKPQSQRLVVCKICCHQFRKSNGMKQACRDPAGKAFAKASDDRQARPQRIARGGVRVIWKRIEEQVRQPMAGEMVFERRRVERIPGAVDRWRARPLPCAGSPRRRDCRE